jgi:2-polyprenyl-3-methyl-5-hydroxy-6-metoxy-1,4-benzoquinol methylase
MTGRFNCLICGADALEAIEGFAELSRVTSDCKPWPAGGAMNCCGACGAIQKLADAKWFGEIEQIYRDYQIYELSGGSEQVIFSEAGVAAPRSKGLVDFIAANSGTDRAGKLIDIGCGNGSQLKRFAAALPGWRLYGSELSDSVRASLQTIPNFVELYTRPIRDVQERFDVVTMFHALEHMPDPLAALRDAAGLLNKDGRLFIEIPNAAISPFDLLIADHLLHFSPAHLGYLASRAGLSVSILLDDLVPKEITLLAELGGELRARPAPAATSEIVRSNVAWLAAMLAEAREAAGRAKTFGVFGTAISGMWLYGALRDKVAFFVDEDMSRVGNFFEGIPILSPAQAPAGSTIFVPLLPEVARRVVGRHAGSAVAYVEPPSR